MDSAEDSGMESSNYCGFLENEIFIPKWIMDRGEELVKESTPFIISYSLKCTYGMSRGLNLGISHRNEFSIY